MFSEGPGSGRCRERLPFREGLWAAGLYAVLTIVFFYPILRSFSTALIGPPEDNRQFYWFLWHGTEALNGARAGFLHTNLIYYPEGVSLLYANYYYYGVGLACLLVKLFSLPAVFNLLILHTFFFSALAAFWLVRYLSGDFKAGLVGGFLFAFSPWHFAHALHHVTVATVQFIPLLVLFFIKAVRRERPVLNSLLASAALVMAALCEWNFLVYGQIFLMLACLYAVCESRSLRIGKVFYPAAAIGFLSVIVLSPLIVPMVRIAMTQTFKRDLPGYDIYVADLLGFLIPSGSHPLGGISWIRDLNGAMTGTPWEKIVYLGWAPVALVLAMLKRTVRECGRFWVGFLAFFVLSLGVSLHVAGHSVLGPLPYKLLETAPLLKNARNPARMAVFVTLFFSVLAGFSVKALFAGKTGRKATVGFAVVSFLIFLDYYSPAYESTAVEIPRVYDAVRRDPQKDFGILELPWDEGRYMFYQTVHGIPSVQGYLGRRFETTLGDRLIYDLKRLDEQRTMLEDHRVKYILIH